MSPNNAKRHLTCMASLIPAVRERFARFHEAAQKAVSEKFPGVDACVICGTRTMDQQAQLYARGRNGNPGPRVTNAKPGSSWHNKGRAIDLGIFEGGVYLDDANPKRADAVYAVIGKVAADHGVEWAGNWKTFQETPHFQITDGLQLGEAINQ